MVIANVTFKHKVSRGSRYNQIYIPSEMEQYFGVGDVVEVKLIEKKNKIFYRTKLELNEFKMKIIDRIFSILEKFKDIEQIIVFGSFLTNKNDFRDIDIALITDKNVENNAYSKLIEEIPFKFHVISFKSEKLRELLSFCPLTRSMLYYALSNKKIEIPQKFSFNKEHIEFLLMMPEDLLKIHIPSSRAYYDNSRRLITIRRFLNKEELDPLKIDTELKIILGALYSWSRNNEEITENNYKQFKLIIKTKLKEIKILLNGKQKNNK